MANTQLLEKLRPLVKKLPAIYFSDACKWQAWEVDDNGQSEAVVLIYREDLSNWDYTKHFVYDVISTITHWGNLRKAIRLLLGDTCESKAMHDIRYKQQPTVANVLREYYTYEQAHVASIEDGDVMRYTRIIPYDD